VKQIKFKLILFSQRGNVLCSVGCFKTKKEALAAVNPEIDRLPAPATWKIIKVTEEVSKEGFGRVPHPRRARTAPSSRER